jgi:hypothetical protein
LAPFGQAVSEEIFLTLANQKKELLMADMFVAILFSDWLLLKKSLKLLGQMEPNLAGSIYVRSSIKLLRFILFFQQIWLPRAILVRIALGSHICWPNGTKRRNFIEDLT